MTFGRQIASTFSYAARNLAKHPGPTAIAVLALALGIGINTATFTGYKAFVARPLDVPDSKSMVNAVARITARCASGQS